MEGPASLTALAAALAPAAILTIWLRVVDRGRTTWELIGQSLTLGALMAPAMLLPAWVFHWAVGEMAPSFDRSQLGSALVSAAIIAPLFEEAGRFCIIVFVLARHEDFHPAAFATVAGWASLGFAGVENAGYLILNEEWGLLALKRATTSVPTHLVLGLVMGTFLAAHTKTGNRSRLLFAYGVPAGLHSLFNATAVSTVYRAGIGADIGLLAVLSVLAAIAAKALRDPGSADDEWRPTHRDRTVGIAIGWCLVTVGVLTVGGSLLLLLRETAPSGRRLLAISATAIMPIAFGIIAIRSARRMPSMRTRTRFEEEVVRKADAKTSASGPG